MALTDNLLKFANLASNNIQEAFGKQTKGKRRVNVRKYAQKRVKRLDTTSKSPKLATPTTKAKSALKNQRQVLARVGSQSWPQLANQTPYVPQTTGVATSGHSTAQIHYSYSEPSMYDPELDTLLSDIIELESNHSPSTSRPASVSPSPSQPTTLEGQVFVAERPISPYSSCSDEFLDSAYSSPLNNYNCSPVAPVVAANPTDWTYVNSPPTSLPPFSTGYSWVEQPVSTQCAWMSTQSTPAITTSVCNQVPMTPTVSELLDQWS